MITLNQVNQYTASVIAGDPKSYTWDFGNGTSRVTGATVNHTYTALGTYTLTLSATNSYHSITINKPVTITVPKRINQPSNDPNGELCSPLALFPRGNDAEGEYCII